MQIQNTYDKIKNKDIVTYERPKRTSGHGEYRVGGNNGKAWTWNEK